MRLVLVALSIGFALSSSIAKRNPAKLDVAIKLLSGGSSATAQKLRSYDQLCAKSAQLTATLCEISSVHCSLAQAAHDEKCAAHLGSSNEASSNCFKLLAGKNDTQNGRWMYAEKKCGTCNVPQGSTTEEYTSDVELVQTCAGCPEAAFNTAFKERNLLNLNLSTGHDRSGYRSTRGCFPCVHRFHPCGNKGKRHKTSNKKFRLLFSCVMASKYAYA
jgi:hypothetical protein